MPWHALIEEAFAKVDDTLKEVRREVMATRDEIRSYHEDYVRPSQMDMEVYRDRVNEMVTCFKSILEELVDADSREIDLEEIRKMLSSMNDGHNELAIDVSNERGYRSFQTTDTNDSAPFGSTIYASSSERGTIDSQGNSNSSVQDTPSNNNSETSSGRNSSSFPRVPYTQLDTVEERG